MPFDFSGKVVAVTGGGSGIGAACATAFHQAGADVTVFGRNEDRLRAVAEHLSGSDEAPSRIHYASLDVSDDDAAERAINALVDRTGRVDCLVNSAADFVAAGLGATTAEWQRSLGVNVIGSARLTAIASAVMPAGSAVVNISSISAHIAQPDRWTYNTTKSAIVELTRCQAMDLAARGIRVNTVSPGWIWTPEVEKAAGGDRAKWEPVWGDYHMLRRLGEASEVASAVLFLCSSDASFITATELMVDGGYRSMGPEGLGAASVFAGSS
jgi:Dehydrogenases with different specificities (related to short-chain alcohol dehydrogenases)